MIFFLLGVIPSVQAMEKESVVSGCSTPADSVPFCFSLTHFPDEINLRFFELVIEDNPLPVAIKNVYSLAATCKDFYRLFNDEQLTSRLILRLEKRMGEPEIKSADVHTSYYWRLFAAAIKLRTKNAVGWVLKKVGNSGPLKDFKRVSSRERMDLKSILLEYYGGLSFAEFRLIDSRPVKILEIAETPTFGKERGRPLKVLSFKSCSLNTLNGLLNVSDLRTVDIFEVSGNVISEIDPTCLARFENLTRLDLAFNNLQTINLGIFAALKKLKTLDLSRNNIQTVSYTAQDKGPDLDKVDLSFNKITTIDPAVLEKISARVIDLKNNNITNAEHIKQLSKPVTKRILVDE